MKFKDRLTIFIIGAILGSILVTVIKSQRAQPAAVVEGPQTAEDIQRAAVPGILQAYQERGVPMQSDFIVASRLYPHSDDDTYIRALILQGEEADQTLRIEETVKKSPKGETVPSVRVMAADRVVASLKPGAPSAELAAAMKPWGYRIVERGALPDSYILSLTEKRPDTVPEAIERIGALPIVVTVTPLYYDR